jgi:hypothetical protein
MATGEIKLLFRSTARKKTGSEPYKMRAGGSCKIEEKE